MNENEKLKIDESQLCEEDRKELHPKLPIGWILFFSIVIVLMIVCIIVINSL